MQGAVYSPWSAGRASTGILPHECPMFQASLHLSVLLEGASQNHRLQLELGGAGRS